MKILITDDSTKWLMYHKSAAEEIFKDDVQIDLAHSAKEGVEKITLSIDAPYDIIMTDMQMETDFIPLYAGEWFIRQIKFFKEYKNTRIIAISAASNIRQIAENYGVLYLPKYKCNDIAEYEKVLK